MVVYSGIANMFSERIIFLSFLALLFIGTRVECGHVQEICGKGQPGDRRPETPEERREETKKEENEDDPDEKKFFHQGDMRMTEIQKEELEKAYKNGEQRDVISYSSAKWQNYTVPYVIDASIVKQTAKDAINGAIRDFHLYSCLWFVERVDEEHYIKFVKETGCWSYVGMLPKYYLDQGYEQTISIGDGCEYKGTAIHEIMHALGFFHEHARIDRDDYVKVNYENMNADAKNNFVKESNQINLGVAYDYNSIMHYPDWAFSNNGKPTLEAIGDAVGAEIGQRDGLTAGDIDQLNIYYGCNDIVKRSLTTQRAAIATGRGKDRQGGKCAIRFQKQKEREAKRKQWKENETLRKQERKKVKDKGNEEGKENEKKDVFE